MLNNINMKSQLRLIYKTEDLQEVDITLSIADWATDYWYEADYVPSNDTELKQVYLDGKVLTVPGIKTEHLTFDKLAEYLGMDECYRKYVELHSKYDKSKYFRKWLTGEWGCVG